MGDSDRVIEFLQAGDPLVRKARVLDHYCVGTAAGGPCPAYERGAGIAADACGGVGVRFEGPPNTAIVAACRRAAERNVKGAA